MSWAQYVKDRTYTSHVVGFNLPWLDSPSYPFTALLGSSVLGMKLTNMPSFWPSIDSVLDL